MCQSVQYNNTQNKVGDVGNVQDLKVEFKVQCFSNQDQWCTILNKLSKSLNDPALYLQSIKINIS